MWCPFWFFATVSTILLEKREKFLRILKDSQEKSLENVQITLKSQLCWVSESRERISKKKATKMSILLLNVSYILLRKLGRGSLLFPSVTGKLVNESRVTGAEWARRVCRWLYQFFMIPSIRLLQNQPTDNQMPSSSRKNLSLNNQICSSSLKTAQSLDLEFL